MKNVNSVILSDLKRTCMRDFLEELGVDWLPTVFGLVDSGNAGLL